ncbi:GxGYxYP domain-containing protein [Dictyobacter aurantiacus]|uniref:GxGYxYP putative glycoside hydrolase N-terminal domain-containing protein n=1 Tax=Dictyobacter aurantiacus TaxID=1936993 RepID=A0A401ZHU9_9CHLR|nr:GxGYxYP domain-containing protein [Dictyobacter aurantiacus]GCE06408.1 hypothetical protein KDAU_37370 [Dictyobacter aurantiacus]
MSGLQWFDRRFLPPLLTPVQLTIYDLRGASRDEYVTATVAAGIVNRSLARIYLITSDDDAFWLEHTFTSVPQVRGPEQGSPALVDLLRTYRSAFTGLLIYDPALPDTINVATTMAGLQDALVVSPDLAERLEVVCDLPVLNDLRTYGWRTRLQAYQWARQHLQPRCSRHVLAGLDPGAFCGLRSFLVASQAFVYWLDSRRYLPEAGKDNVSERGLLRHLLAFYAPGAVHMGWVIHEQSAVAMTSAVGIAVVASDYALNLEVWMALPVARMPIPPAPTRHVERREKIYLSFTMSDGDNLQYCQHRLRALWQDPARGTIPLGWTFPPLLTHAAPALAAYYTGSATALDELVAGPSGLGYIYPSRWPRHLLSPFLQQTGSLMQSLDMSILDVLDVDAVYRTGLPLVAAFSLQGMQLRDHRVQHQFARELAPYGVRNIFSGAGFTGKAARWQQVGDLTIYHHLGFTDSVERTVRLIRLASTLFRRRPLFLSIYLIAWTMTPSMVGEVMAQLGEEYEVVLPGTLFSLLRT